MGDRLVGGSVRGAAGHSQRPPLTASPARVAALARLGVAASGAGAVREREAPGA